MVVVRVYTPQTTTTTTTTATANPTRSCFQGLRRRQQQQQQHSRFWKATRRCCCSQRRRRCQTPTQSHSIPCCSCTKLPLDLHLKTKRQQRRRLRLRLRLRRWCWSCHYVACGSLMRARMPHTRLQPVLLLTTTRLPSSFPFPFCFSVSLSHTSAFVQFSACCKFRFHAANFNFML